MTGIMLAHAPEAGARAALVACKLGARGYKVWQAANGYFAPGPLGRRRLAADIAAADCVVVLWSRDAAEAPGLHAVAARASALGKLAFARLDTAPVPSGLHAPRAADISAWGGREGARGWRHLLAVVAAKARGAAGAPRPAPGFTPEGAAQIDAPPKRGGAGAVLFAIGVVAIAAIGAGAYFFFF